MHCLRAFYRKCRVKSWFLSSFMRGIGIIRWLSRDRSFETGTRYVQISSHGVTFRSRRRAELTACRAFRAGAPRGHRRRLLPRVASRNGRCGTWLQSLVRLFCFRLLGDVLAGRTNPAKTTSTLKARWLPKDLPADRSRSRKEDAKTNSLMPCTE
jgi:hypothetical protein